MNFVGGGKIFEFFSKEPFFCFSFSLTHYGGNRDMPPSIAVSIAEGRLNPITMEAFNYFSSEECRQDLKQIKNNERLPRTEAVEVFGKDSCFMVFVGKDRERHIPG